MHITLSKIQGLVYKNESDLSSRLAAQKPMREAFDGALTGCRMTLAALNLELDKLVEPRAVTEKGAETMKIGFQVKRKLVWKENTMKKLLDQTRGQMSSLQCLILFLESENQADIFKLLKQKAADIRKIFHRAKSIRLDQGIDDDQSSFHLAHQSISFGLVPSYETQLLRSSTYQRAQTAAAEELLAGKIELMDEKYALEEKLEGLFLDVDLKVEKITQLEQALLLKEEHLLSKEKRIAELEGKIMRRDKAQDSENSSTIHWVARNGYTKPVDQPLGQGVNINTTTIKGANMRATTKAGSTALDRAARNGHVEVVKILLEKGASKEAATHVGLTPLHQAAAAGQVEVAKALLKKGANKDAVTWSGSTPLHKAVFSGQVEVVKILLEKRANKEAATWDGWTPLHLAAVYGQVEILKILLEKGANKEARRNDRCTPLHAAADSGHDEVAEILLEKGANKKLLARMD